MRNTCLELLAQALRVGEQELAALIDGKPEQAQECEDKRSRLTQQALEACHYSTPPDTDVLLVEFQKLNDMQKCLTRAAEDLRRNWQKELAASRRESRRLAGYRQASSYALQ